MNNTGQGYARFALLPHAHRRERMDQAALSLQQITGLLLFWWTSHCPTMVPHPLWAHETCSASDGRQLCWAQGGLWTFQDKYMYKSPQGWGSQDTAYSEPEKQLFWRTLLKLEFLGVTQVVQKCIALNPRIFFWKGGPSTHSKMCSLPALPASLFQHLPPAERPHSPFLFHRAHFTLQASVNWGLSLHTILVLLTNSLSTKGQMLLVNLHKTDRNQHTEGSPSCSGSMRY